MGAQVRTGELALRRLPAVLLDLHEDAASGRLLLRRGRISKTVDFAEGDLVSATSTNRDETLGHFLVGAGVITAAQHREAVGIATAQQLRVGAALVGMGALTPDKLLEQLTNQTRHKLILALRWPQGAWRFDPAPPGAAPDGLRLRLADVVLSGLRATAGTSPEELEALRRLDGLELELTPRGRALLVDLHRVFGTKVIDVIAAGEGASIAAIERAAGDSLRGRQVADALLACAAAETRAPAIGLGAIRPPTRPPPVGAPIEAEDEGDLFDMLFGLDGSGGSGLADGAAPVEIIDDELSGAVAGPAMTAAARVLDDTTTARRALLKEYLRVQGADHYGVLVVEPRATPMMIAAALTERASMFAPAYYARFDLGPDTAKLDAVHAAYDRARAVLLDDVRRRAYDRELAGGELADTPSLDAELTFRRGEDLMAKGRWAQAVPVLEAATRASPGTAAYLTALGWAAWNASAKDGAGADVARVHLAAALAADPDHAAAHDYKGRISAVLGVDASEAAFHLERALELEPTRGEALALLEQHMLATGEVRRLERLYKRLLYRVRGKAPPVEIALWVRLGTLYGRHLDDHAAARTALAQAQALGGPSVTLPDLRGEGPVGDAAVHAARARWHGARSESAGVELVAAAEASGDADTAFLAASALVALDVADAHSDDLYRRQRPAELRRPSGPLSATHWQRLRHPDDVADVGALIELLAPVVHALAPMRLVELDVDDGQRLDDAELPPAFARLRGELAALVGVAPAPVYVRSELGRQVHVGALATPILLAGDEALTAPARAELAFALARASTYLWPGRAVGASRPGRVLRQAVMAMFREAAGADVGASEPGADAADAALEALADDARLAARGAVLRLVAREPTLNLSRWAKALGRTADRVGLLACGDVPAALAAARDLGGDVDELVAFATSREHHELRAALGLAVG